jgi:tRNA(Ile)-lysidine synthase
VLNPAAILNILMSECGYREGDSILVGVSGGADSVALLHLLHEANVPVAAAHVNYGLRGEESDGDEQFVSELCAKWNVPLYLRKTNADELNSLSNNLQNSARILRYGFFAEIMEKEAMPFLAVAHHQDDQLETVLINFLRGSGLSGMTGMDVLEDSVISIVRPLLYSTRISIEEYLREKNLHWRNDSSNLTDDYLRNRLRKEVIPGIHAIDERNSKGWNTSVQQMKNAHTLLYALASPFIEHSMTSQGMTSRVSKKRVQEFAHPHVLFNWILHHKNFQLQFTEKEFEAFVLQQPGKKYFSRDGQLTVDRDYWLFSEHSGSGSTAFTLEPGHDKNGWSCNAVPPVHPERYSGDEALIDRDQITGHLTVRNWKAGDSMQPFGFNGTRKVSDVLTEMKVPSDGKWNYPVLTDGDEIVWIPGYRIAEKFKVTDTTQTALHIRWNR